MADDTVGAPEQTAGPEELSFGALRRLGIDLAQQLAADDWTDYNIHDPGVTLLEQFCYALTDLVHRADFDVADHLTSPDGRIDFERLGLELPERIFPCRPTTLADYRRVIHDRVADVGEVRVTPIEKDGAGGTPRSGLYRILVRPRSGAAKEDLARLRETVERVYSGFRNLCEDVQEIAFVHEENCVICAEVEVGRGRAPAEILAEIYFRCVEQIAARVRIHPFEQARRSRRGLEDVFAGPLGLHGICDDEDLERGQETHEVSEFFSLVNRVEGVDYVRDLYFQVSGQIERDAIGANSAECALRLHIPEKPNEIQIRLSSQGRPLQVPFETFKDRLDARMLEGFGNERAPQDPRKLYTLPQGEYRDLRQYSSIQTQLPSIYGVGVNGLPESAPLAARARARQLKGYLLLFDQLMANYTANVAGLRDLFSCDVRSRTTYASQTLDESQVSDLDEIYARWPEDVSRLTYASPLLDEPRLSDSEEIFSQRSADVIGAVLARYDNFGDRKGRQLDYLLALYGEGFSQNALRAFDFYATREEREQALVENKVRYLRAIAQVTRDRGAAIDYRDPDRKTVSGLQLRVGYLLAFDNHSRRSLTATLLVHKLRPIPDDLIVEAQDAGTGPGLRDSADIRPPDNAWDGTVPLTPDGDEASLSRLMEQVGHLLPRRDCQFPEAVLSGGISVTSYRLGHLEGDVCRWQVFLASGDAASWWRLGAFEHRADAIEAVNKLRRLIVLLNKWSEGMHVIEHILLRPRGAAERARAASVADADFFEFRLSVIFPAWTARFRDPGFRELARETVCLNCPAHVVPAVICLEFDDMWVLEQLQGDWLRRLAADGAAAENPEAARKKLDAASARLVEFLKSRSGEEGWMTAPTTGSGG